MITDPSWLYSTIAQSSAAIVAIVGGFITASVLMLTAEKRSLANQKKDKEARLQTLKNEKGTLSQELDTREVEIFIESITDKIIDSKDMPSLEEVINDNTEAQSLNPVILKREYEVFSSKIIKAKKFIITHLEKIKPKSVTFVDWVKMNNLDISKYDYEILERLYDKVLGQKLEQKQESLPAWERATLSPTLLRMRLPHITPISEQQELQRLRQNIQEYTGEIAVLENDVNNLDFRISKFSYPPNLGWGLGVLGFLTVVGILFPVFLIWTELYSDIARKIIVYCFYASILGLFAYIASQIYSLRR